MGLLLILFIAMQFTEEVNWDIGDFMVMGIMLSTTGISIQFFSINLILNLKGLY